jgi:N12 class adenine-specific DNA methylase
MLPVILEQENRQRLRQEKKTAFLKDVDAGKRSINPVSKPLYPYQREGMLHLAFGGRTMLADEMGLGKTVQAIAACELLHELHGIRRVLVICPSSLKAEWEEQIELFTDRSARLIYGTRAARLRAYRDEHFYSIANYEQVRNDVETFELLRRLEKQGIIAFTTKSQPIFSNTAGDTPDKLEELIRRYPAEAAAHLKQSERKRKMTHLLYNGELHNEYVSALAYRLKTAKAPVAAGVY